MTGTKRCSPQHRASSHNGQEGTSQEQHDETPPSHGGKLEEREEEEKEAASRTLVLRDNPS